MTKRLAEIKIDDNSSEKSRISAYVNALASKDREIEELTEKLKKTEVALIIAEEEKDKAQEELEEITSTLMKQKEETEILKRRLALIEQSKKEQNLQSLLHNDTIRRLTNECKELKDKIAEYEEKISELNRDAIKQKVAMQMTEETARAEVARARDEMSALEEEITRLKKELFALNQYRETDQAKIAEYLSERARLEMERDQQGATLRALEAELESLRRQNERKEKELEDERARRMEMERVVQELEKERNALRMEIARLNEESERLRELRDGGERALGDLSSELECVRGRLAAAEQELGVLRARWMREAMLRRRLHNEIQEMKGSIRVYCRVRPPLCVLGCGDGSAGRVAMVCQGVGVKTLQSSGTGAAPHTEPLAVFEFPDGELEGRTLCVGGHGTNGTHTGTAGDSVQTFVYDKVFGPWASQSEVFEDVSQLVQSALDGYRVCIFAYGQTGSGKTFTMEGPGGAGGDIRTQRETRVNADRVVGAVVQWSGQPRGDTETHPLLDGNAGIIPRSIIQIFQYAEQRAACGWKFRVLVRYVEIYNETIRDLLTDTGSGPGTECEIVATDPGTGRVRNALVKEVKCVDDVLELVAVARARRASAETAFNARSSRSHSVFSLFIEGINGAGREVTEGVLNLVDLAGSERAQKNSFTGQSKDQREREREMIAINQSLTTLGKVIRSLGGKGEYVPYRDSKLTLLLQPSLSKNSKILMFVTIAPELRHLSESLNSLMFAQKVNQVRVGPAKKQIKEVE